MRVLPYTFLIKPCNFKTLGNVSELFDQSSGVDQQVKKFSNFYETQNSIALLVTPFKRTLS